MKEELIIYQEDQFLKEFLLIHGFKMVATKDPLSILDSKHAILLQTGNMQLFKGLKKWAWKNDIVILYNPEQLDFEVLNQLYAFVIDSDFIYKFPFPKLLNSKYIKSELEFDLLEDILTNFKIIYENYSGNI